MNYGEWPPYVSVAQRRARAIREMKKLRKQGRDIVPIEILGRKIAATFWGESWCRHLERFSDFANRLPRGRTYVRNGEDALPTNVRDAFDSYFTGIGGHGRSTYSA